MPCYVNSRLASRGIPVSREVDIYGALSEYLATCATEPPATLLDINNTVPHDLFLENKDAIGTYEPSDLFKHAGKSLFAAVKMLGVEDVSFNQPKGMLYRTENPFA